ncbi:unnamed protein product [Spodoptera exigua]|nr:unnamed protein product [Spodoptera exigua]
MPYDIMTMDCQFGFRRGRSTVDAIMFVMRKQSSSARDDLRPPTKCTNPLETTSTTTTTITPRRSSRTRPNKTTKMFEWTSSTNYAKTKTRNFPLRWLADSSYCGKRYEVSAIIHHENFTYFVNDIALVRTREPVGLGPTVATVSVNNLGTENLYLTSKVKLIGWGSAGSSNSKVLQEVSIQLIGWDLCANIYSKKGITTTNMICGERPTGEGMCAFHLGGPLVLGDILVAIASSFSCQDKKIQDLYTMVSRYTEWIQQEFQAMLEAHIHEQDSAIRDSAAVALLLATRVCGPNAPSAAMHAHFLLTVASAATARATQLVR